MSAADELTAALAEECARHTVEAFARYNAEFRAITRRAPLRFDSRDLRASQQAAIHTSVGTNTYLNHGSLSLLFEDLLGDVRFRSPWRDLDGSIAHVTAEVRSHLRSRGELAAVQKVEVIRPVFYQVSRAYVVGRIVGRGLLLPLVIALKNSESGVLVDAVMLAEDDVSIVFSFTRSYFRSEEHT